MQRCLALLLGPFVFAPGACEPSRPLEHAAPAPVRPVVFALDLE
jgi:hypothetical protein